MTNKKFFLAVWLLSIPFLSYGQSWQPKQAPLMTRFAQDVNPNNTLPKYPRPQMVRDDWLNLNGLWDFQAENGTGSTIPQSGWNRKILVPFPVESALSGIMEHHPWIWYRRTFNIPDDWDGQDILLHFGAVDFKAEVYVNGKKIGTHFGGYNPFTLNITRALKQSGPQQIVVHVFDPTDNAGAPRGKQSLNPGGIMYTSSTGIWQTVWLEPVPETHISDIRIIPDIDNDQVKLTVNTEGDASGISVNARVKDEDRAVQHKSGTPNTQFSIPIPDPKLWSPDHPFLYDLDISLTKNSSNVDKISSYVGMRKISIEKVDGVKKMFLNNKFVFELGPLDQGFWPDGLYTAPTDEALKYDLKVTKDLGFNMVRKHIKVEPQRWYYYADKMGLLVWQDMPSPNSYTPNTPPVDKPEFASELTRMIKTHWNAPSIIMWDVFNESQGQHNTAELVQRVKSLDPTRLVNQASGGRHVGAGDVFDVHSYPAPSSPVSDTKARVVGEYGGIGYKIKGHLWANDGSGYIGVDNDAEYDSLYRRFANELAGFKTNNGLSAAVYTQTTDVEKELNGLMTYDRAIIKGDKQKIKQANENAINRKLYVTDLLPTSQKEAQRWRYTFQQPAMSSWMLRNFDDSSWKKGPGGFGTEQTPGAVVNTVWDTDDIWLRQRFILDNLSGINRSKLVLKIHHDEDAEVYINGVKAADLGGYTSGYATVFLNKAGRKALNLNGHNIIAIHCHQTKGGQYIDAGIAVRSFDEPLEIGKGNGDDTSNPDNNRPTRLKLHQNYPNPFKPSFESMFLCINVDNNSHVRPAMPGILGRKDEHQQN